MAEQVFRDAPPNGVGRARHAFRLCLSREPTAAESGQLAALAAAEQAVSPDSPAAAWTRVCRVLLNLDETITRE